MPEWITVSTPYLSPRGSEDKDPWQLEAARAGAAGSSRLVTAGYTAAPPGVAERLGIDPGSPAVRRRRVVTLDERPVEIADSWYPLTVAEGTRLAQPRPIKGGAMRLLAQHGYTATWHLEDIAVIDPPEDAAEFIGRAAVIELTRTSYTNADFAFEVAVMLMTREMSPGVQRKLRYLLRTA